MRGRKLLFIEQLVCFGALNICFHPLHNSVSLELLTLTDQVRETSGKLLVLVLKKSYYGKIKYIKRSQDSIMNSHVPSTAFKT